MPRRFVLFDFDGVIADSFGVASELAYRVCKQNTPAQYRSAFEGNIYDAIEREKSGGKRPDHGPECEHDLDWWGEYEKMFARVSPFPGMIDVIKTLASSYVLIIVTSGHRDFIDPFLKSHGVDACFTDILDVDAHTHKTKKIEMVFEKYETDARHCVFITDTLGDVKEAAHHSIGAIAVDWGFHAHETLEKGVPFRIASAPAELPDAVEEYFAQMD